MPEKTISQRSQQLLKVLIEHYISDGKPVGSRTLAKESSIELSSATIRNVMSDLEDIGFISAPHTSAGRIPTIDGYRFFVDSLLTIKSPSRADIKKIKNSLSADLSTAELVENTSKLLSEVTNLAGIVLLPTHRKTTLRQIEFLPLSENRILVITVLNEKEVQNSIIHTPKIYKQNELIQVANYLNELFSGQSIEHVREQLLGELQLARKDMDTMMRSAIDLAERTFDVDSQEDYILSGQSNLLDFSELGELNQLKRIFDTFNKKHDVLRLLDQSLHAQGMQIFIGNETGESVLNSCSMITSTYKEDGKPVGVLGVIGPTRLNYQNVIPFVDITAKFLTAAFDRQ
jgi:heat-inducible transcriptional repressor